MKLTMLNVTVALIQKGKLIYYMIPLQKTQQITPIL